MTDIPSQNRFWSYAIVSLSLVLMVVWALGSREGQSLAGTGAGLLSSAEDSVQSAALPVAWGDIGVRMVREGVIDRAKFLALYEGRGGLSEDGRALLEGAYAGTITANSRNAGALLNLFWALGLSNKNRILDEGPMADPQYGQYGGPAGFASTGGWTLGAGDAMLHYSTHEFVVLSASEQELVERVSRNVYRPCCNNPAYFPDCNHGMAMLGFLELAASQGATEEEMYRGALALNRLWFPDVYRDIDAYLKKRGSGLNAADPKVVVGPEFSSATGYQRILAETTPQPRGGSSCGA